MDLLTQSNIMDEALFRDKPQDQAPINNQSQGFAPSANPSPMSGAGQQEAPIWESFVTNTVAMKNNREAVAREQAELRDAAQRQRQANTVPTFKGSNGKLLARQGGQTSVLDPTQYVNDPLAGSEAKRALWDAEIQANRKAANEARFNLSNPEFQARALKKTDREMFEAEASMLPENDQRRNELKGKIAADDEFLTQKQQLEQDAWDREAKARAIEAQDPESWWHYNNPAYEQERAAKVKEAQDLRAGAETSRAAAAQRKAEIQQKLAQGVDGREVESLQAELGRIDAYSQQIDGIQGEADQEIEAVAADARDRVQKKEQEQQGIGDFLRGAEVSIKQIPQLFYGVMGLIGETAEQTTGVGQSLRDWGFKGYLDAEQKNAPLSRENDDVEVAWKKMQKGDVGAMVDWVQYGLGYVTGQAAETLAVAGLGALAGGAAAAPTGPGAAIGAAGGAAGGVVAKGAAKSLAKRLVENAIAKQALKIADKQGIKMTAEEITQGAAGAAIRKTAAQQLGRNKALLVNGMGMTLGSIYPEAEKKAQEEGRELNGTDLARIWATGVAAGTLEGIADKLGVDLLTGNLANVLPKGRIAAAIAGGAGDATVEASTELAQTILERFGAGKEITGAEAGSEYLNAAALGGLGGAAMGGAGGLLNGGEKQEAPTTPTKAEQTKPLVDTALAGIDPEAAPTQISEIVDAALMGGTNPQQYAELVLVNRELAQAREAEQQQQAANISAIQSQLDEAVAGGAKEATLKQLRTNLEEAQKPKASKASLATAAVKIGNGLSIGELTADELQALGYESKAGEPDENGNVQVEFTPIKKEKGDTSLPMIRAGADGSVILTDEALRQVAAVSPKARATIKWNEAKTLEVARKRAEKKLSEATAGKNGEQGEPATGRDSLIRTPSAGVSEFDVTMADGQVLRVPAATAYEAEQEAAARAPMGVQIVPGSAVAVQKAGGNETQAPLSGTGGKQKARTFADYTDEELSARESELQNIVNKAAVENDREMAELGTKALEKLRAEKAKRAGGGTGGTSAQNLYDRKRFADDDYSQEALLHLALLGIEGSPERWDAARKEGATDAELKAIIGREFGTQGGSWKGGMFWGAENPRMEFPIAGGGKKMLKGKELIQAVRDLMQIPQPTGKTGEKTPGKNTQRDAAVAGARKELDRVRKNKRLADAITVGTARAEAVPGKITINPEAIIDNAIEKGMTPKQAGEYFKRILDEEIRHLAQYEAGFMLYQQSKSTEPFAEWFEAHYAKLWQDFGADKQEIVRTLYAKGNTQGEANWESMSDTNKMLEAIRMMSQGKKVTEQAKLWANISAELTKAIKMALAALRRFGDVVSPEIKAEITNLENALREFTTDTAKPSRPTDANRSGKPAADGKAGRSGEKAGSGSPGSTPNTREAEPAGRAEPLPDSLVGRRVEFERNGETLTGVVTFERGDALQVKLDAPDAEGVPTRTTRKDLVTLLDAAPATDTGKTTTVDAADAAIEELQNTGVTYFGGTRYQIQQGDDEMFSVLQTTSDGKRIPPTSWSSTMEGAQAEAVRMISAQVAKEAKSAAPATVKTAEGSGTSAKIDPRLEINAGQTEPNASSNNFKILQAESGISASVYDMTPAELVAWLEKARELGMLRAATGKVKSWEHEIKGKLRKAWEEWQAKESSGQAETPAATGETSPKTPETGETRPGEKSALTNEQKAQIAAIEAEYQGDLRMADQWATSDPEMAGKKRKAAGMVKAAKMREVTGNLTAKERQAKEKFEASNYTGKPVSVFGKNGKVSGVSFGKVKVDFEDGTNGRFDPENIEPPIKQQAEPEVSNDTPATVFVSGLSRSNKDMDAEIAAGNPVGVSVATVLTEPMRNKIVNYVNGGGSLFVDSGAVTAFHQKLKGNADAETDWQAVMGRYKELFYRITPEARSRVYFVAPDVVGDFEATADLQAETYGMFQFVMEDGGNIVMPIQKRSDEDTDIDVGSVDTWWARDEYPERFVIGVPFNDKAWKEDDVIRLLQREKQMQKLDGGKTDPRENFRIHLLGGGRDKVESLIARAKSLDLPFQSISGDSFSGKARDRKFEARDKARKEVSKTKKARRITSRMSRPQELFQNNPVIAAIISKGGIMSATRARKEMGEAWWKENKSLYDDAPTFANPSFNTIYSRTGTLTPDKLAQALASDGILADDVNALWAEIGKAADSATRINRQTNTEEERMDLLEKQTIAFEKGISDTSDTPIEPWKLEIGDKVVVDGERMEVTDIEFDDRGNPESITLLDGSKFARQTIGADQVIYVEALEKNPANYDEDEPNIDFGGDIAETPALTLETQTDEQIKEEAAAAKRKQEIEDRKNKRLTGSTGDLTADMFGGGETPLFDDVRSGKKAEKPPADPALDAAMQQAKDVLKGLFAGELADMTPAQKKAAQLPQGFEQDIPQDRFMALMGAANSLVQAGVNTPEKLAEAMDNLAEDRKALPFTQRFWDAMRAAGAKGAAEPKWSTIYRELDASKVEEPEAEEKPSPMDTAKQAVMTAVSKEAEKLAIKAATENQKFTRDQALTGPLARTLTRKEADEAIEAGITAAAHDIAKRNDGVSGMESGVAFRRLVSLYENQPSLTAKTSTSKINQAYSTPAPMAFVAGELLEINAGNEVITEPTFGHGMLLMGAPASSTIIANELDPARRARTLGAIPESANWIITGEDATTWTPAQTPNKVASNPPFGSVMGEDGSNIVFQTSAGETTAIDHAIMLKALEDMAPDGRAVFIIGGPAKTLQSEKSRKEHYASGKRGRFFKHLHDNYGVIDHFTVSGDLYTKQGAGWNVDIIVIQGKGKSRTDLPSAKAPRMITDWNDLFKTTQLTDNERIQLNRISEEEVRESVRGMVDALAGIGNLGRSQRNGERSDAGNGRTGTSGQNDNSVSSQSDESNAADAQDVGRMDGESDGNLESDASRVEQRPNTGREGTGVDRPTQGSGNAKRAVRSEVKESGKFQAEYTPFSGEKGLDTLLPRNMVLPVTEAFDRIRRDLGDDLTGFVRKQLGYPEGTDITQYLAGEQIDAVAAAIWNFQNGGALIIGDQTGIGKGRIVAALLKYAVHQGYIPVFMTKDPGLHDAMLTEDLPDIAAPEIIPAVMDTKLQFDSAKKRKLEYGEEYFAAATDTLPGKSNAIFVTYSQLQADDAKGLTKGDRASARNAGEAPADKWRMAALRRIAPNAVFILDESHLASGQSTTGFRVADLLARSPRVYYSSATSVKRPENMGIYFKTNVGMLTNGNMGELTELMNAGGVPAMQVVSSMLAQDGQYLRRERSFEGVKFETQISEDTAMRDTALADGLTGALREIVTVQDAMKQAAQAINSVIEKAGKSMKVPAANRAKLETTNFSSKLHNIVSQYLLAIKVQSAADTAIREIQAGKKVVVAVQSTMESAIDALEFGGFDMSYKGLVLRYLDQMRFLKSGNKAYGRGEVETFEITERGPEKFDNMNDRTLQGMIVERSRDANGDLVININEEVATELMRRSMWDVFSQARENIEGINLGNLPLSPIDTMRQMVESAGIRTGEITGRKRGIDENGEIYSRSAQDTSKPARRIVQSAFNNEDLDFLVINQSGSTGISLHASQKAKNQATRVMIVAQPNLDINEFMQTLGRIHRSGQVVSPEFILLQTALPAEKRPAAILGKKMSMLNANTTSNAKTDVSEGNTAIDIFNQYGDEIAYKVLERDPDIQRQLRPLGSSLEKFFNPLTGNLIPFQDAQKEVQEQPDGYIARTITGYLAILPVEEQEIFWEKTLADYGAYISYLDQIGQNALEAKALDLKAKTLSREIFTEQAEGESAFSAPSYIELVETKIGKKPLVGKDAMELSERVKKNAQQKMSAYIAAADAAANDQADKKSKRALKEWDAEKRAEFLAGQRAQRNVIANAISLTGKFGSVNRDDGNTGLGVVEEIKLDESVPLTPSKQVAVIRVNDSRETLRVPVTQLNDAFTPDPSNLFPENVWDDTTDIGGEAAIATGNLMRAMKALGGSGKVITYTTETGEDRMGILLPKNFITKRQATKSRVAVDTVEKLETFLENGMKVANGDGTIKWTKGNEIFALAVPASRSKGGDIWRNPVLNRISLGGEFTQVSNEMRATFWKKDVPQVLTMLKDLGETFSTVPDNGTTPLQAGELPDAAAVRSYLDSNGTPRDVVASESKRVSGALEQSARSGLAESGTSYPAPNLDIFGDEKPATPSATLGSQVSDAASRAVSRSKADSARSSVSDDLKKGFAGDWDALARVVNAKGRASAILADLINREIPAWNVNGSIIEGPADIHALMLPIRSPYFESLKVMVLDGNNQISHSQILTVGTLNEVTANPAEILGVLARLRETSGKKHNRLIFSHNHPSGDPSPSSADERITKMLHDLADMAGFNVIDHIITNGEKFYSFREMGSAGSFSLNERTYTPRKKDGKSVPLIRPEDRQAPWEAVPRSVLRVIDQPEKISEVAAHLRNANPDAAHIFYTDTRLRLTAVERFDKKELTDRQAMVRRILAARGREGAYSFSLDVPEDQNNAKLAELLGEIANRTGIRHTDTVSLRTQGGGYFSARAIGLMEEFTPLRAGELADTPPFYSQLSRTIEAKMPALAPVPQVLAIANGGAKAEEIKWSGLEQQAIELAKANKGKVPKADLLRWLADEGSVRFEEAVLSDEDLVSAGERFGISVGEDYGMFSFTNEETGEEMEFDELPNEMKAILGKKSPTRFGQYTLPGGENYREVVLAMPSRKDEAGSTVFLFGTEQDRDDFVQDVATSEYADNDWQNLGDFSVELKDSGDNVINALKQMANRYGVSVRNHTETGRPQGEYTSSHFPDVPNYVAHMRLNERDGGLFIEEIQSDRHQAGRKQGYKGEVDVVAAIDKLTREQATRIIKLNERGNDTLEGDESIEDLRNAVRSYLDNEGEDESGETFKFLKNLAGTDGIPDAPFRTSWPLAMFKRALRDAVASGKDWIGWTTGETQNDRFDLSKIVDKIIATTYPDYGDNNSRLSVDVYMSGETPVLFIDDNGIVVSTGNNANLGQVVGKPLDEVLGKDVAQRIMDIPRGAYSTQTLSGDQLKVGGSGMKGFYDTMLPKEIGKYVKQWGAKVEKSSIQISDKDSDGEYQQTPFDPTGEGTPIWRIDITPAMRAGVQAGQPLFAAELADSPSDAAYLKAVESGDMKTAQRMVDDAARAAGYNRKGVRFGFYVNGVPLPPSIGEQNFGPGYYVAEDADTSIASGSVSVSPTPNKKSLEEAGLSEADVEFRRDVVYVKAERPVTGSSGLSMEDKQLLDAEIAYQSAVNDAFSSTGRFGYLNLKDRAKSRGASELEASITSNTSDNQKYLRGIALLIKQGKINYDSLRGVGGRTYSGEMSSELVVQNPSQIKSADPVTYDNAGNVIPLSQRFNPQSDSILRAGDLSDEAPAGDVFRRTVKMNPALIAEAKEQREIFGKNVGDAGRLAGFGSEKTRAELDAVTAVYEFTREVQANADQMRLARQMLASNPADIDAKALDAITNKTFALTPADHLAISLRIDQRVAEAKGNVDKLAEAGAMAMAYRLIRADAGRLLQIGFDRMMTPAERNLASLTEAIFTPTKKIGKVIESKPLAQRQAFIRAAAEERVKKVEAELAKFNLDIQAVTGKAEKLALANSRLMKDAKKLRNLLDQDVIGMVQKGAAIADIRRRYGAEVAATAQETITATRAQLAEKIRPMIEAGMTMEEIIARVGKLQAGSLPGNAATPSQNAIAAELERILTIGFGLPAIVPEKNKVERLKTPKPKANAAPPAAITFDPLKADWSRPILQKGLEKYEFDAKDLAGIKTRVGTVTTLAGAVGQVGKLEGAKRQQAEAAIDQIEMILSKYGSSIAELTAPETDIESYRFDINDINHVATVARMISTMDADWIDKTSEILYANMLSGLQTAMVNATAIIPAAWEATVGRGVETAINAFVKDPMSAQFGESKYIAAAIGPAITRAMSNFSASMQTQHPMSDRDLLNQNPDIERIMGGKGYRMGGSVGGRKGDIIRIPMRLLMATDDFNMTLFSVAQVGTYAFRIAKAKGLKPGSVQFDREMRQLVNTPGSEAWVMAFVKTKRAIFANPLPGEKDQATNKVVPVNGLGDMVGYAAGKLNKALTAETESQFVKAVQLAMKISFFPFQRVPFNILRKGVRYTLNPVSLFDIGLGFIQNSRTTGKDGKTVWQWNAGGRNPELIERMGMQLQGAIVMALLIAASASEGDDEDQEKPFIITGSLPYTPQGRAEREAQTRAGMGPYRISFRRKDGSERFGFNYGRLEPLATALGATVDSIKSFKRTLRAGGDVSEAGAEIAGGLVSQAQDKTFLRGVGDLVGLVTNAIATPDVKDNRKMQQFLAGRVAMVMPNIIKQPLREADSLYRDKSNGFVEELSYQMFPYGQKEAKVDVYGREATKTGTPVTRVFDVSDTGTNKVHPVDAMLLRWRDSGKWSKLPNEADRKPWFPQEIYAADYKDPVTGIRREMTPEQMKEFRTRAGKLTEAMLARQNLNYENPTYLDVEKVRDVVSKARSQTKLALSFKFSRQPN